MSAQQDSAQSAPHLGQQWTICIHATYEGDMLDAEHVADLMKRLAQRRGCRDSMIEILAQEAGR